jgi:hypothetical protein
LATSQTAGARRDHQGPTHHVREVVVEHVLPNPAASQHRLDDPAHPVLAQTRQQRIDVRATLLDDRLLGRLHMLGRHRHRPVLDIAVDDLVGQGIDQPRMPLRQLVDEVHGARIPALARVVGVLLQQLGHVLAREHLERGRLRRDVERRAGAQPRHRPAVFGRHHVVADLAHAHQHHRVRKRRGRPVDVPRPKLRQERDHRRPHQPVRFVEEHHQRQITGSRHGREPTLHAGGEVAFQSVDVGQTVRAPQIPASGAVETIEDDREGAFRLGSLACGLQVHP